ncbi:DUF484 family protein [Larsenimonas rhizosphaerae]|uniref:DUF484 family protein n=1 Tax=Larsenimonas rhizosphaerae TaxID=2944682 RepID=A0AA42CYG1_9GAMM|nr:DUF484 family protein [Larsenimonas rhizosphaerae]MCX2525173.1 DUF484 family protein [Larsenimonas rhizosphaerae]
MPDMLTAAQVAAWLETHPDFFETREALLDQLDLPHPVHGHAVPIREYQLARLQQREQQSSAGLSSLCVGTRQDQGRQQRLRMLVLALLEAESPDALGQQLAMHLAELFNSEATALWRPHCSSAPCYPPSHAANLVISQRFRSLLTDGPVQRLTLTTQQARLLLPGAPEGPARVLLMSLPLGAEDGWLLCLDTDRLDRSGFGFIGDITARLLTRMLS